MYVYNNRLTGYVNLFCDRFSNVVMPANVPIVQTNARIVPGLTGPSIKAPQINKAVDARNIRIKVINKILIAMSFSLVMCI